MQIKLPFVIRRIAGECVLVPVGDTTRTLNGLITLNEVGAFLWEQLPDAADEADLTDRVLAAYEVSREQAAADVADFLQQLRSLAIV